MTTKQAAPATPLPWRTDEYIRERICAGADRDAQVAKIFTIPRGANDAQTDRARQQDAAYIVAACNAYPRLMAEREQLVAALRAVVDAYTVTDGVAGKNPAERATIREQARALLARLGAE